MIQPKRIIVRIPPTCPTCPECFECPEFSTLAMLRINELVREKKILKEKLEQVRIGNLHECLWHENDIRAYGKPYYDLTKEELKQHDLYKKDIKNAIKHLQAILNGDEL